MLPSSRSSTSPPLDYSTPSFPALYWPIHVKPGIANYLYYPHDIWRYTLLWTLIIFAVFHLAVAGFAVLMQLGKGKNAWKYAWIIPLAYSLIAGIEALIAGSAVGLMYVYLTILLWGISIFLDPFCVGNIANLRASLGAVYNAGYFKMSTWIPFVWSLINVLPLTISSFSIQGAL